MWPHLPCLPAFSWPSVPWTPSLLRTGWRSQCSAARCLCPPHPCGQRAGSAPCCSRRSGHTHTQIATTWSHTAEPHSPPFALPPTDDLTHQAADGLSQLLELSTPDGVRAVLHHGVHVRVQVPAQHTYVMWICPFLSFTLYSNYNADSVSIPGEWTCRCYVWA